MTVPSSPLPYEYLSLVPDHVDSIVGRSAIDDHDSGFDRDDDFVVDIGDVKTVFVQGPVDLLNDLFDTLFLIERGNDYGDFNRLLELNGFLESGR